MAPAKKQPGRFTVQFDLRDPQQQQVAELLNRLGRKKAAFLTSAVLAYSDHREPPRTTASPAIDEAMVEQIVKRLLSEYHLEPAAAPVKHSSTVPTPSPEEAPDFSENDLLEICRAMDSFRA